MFIWFCPLILLYAQSARSSVADIPVNYDEARIPSYTLPNPLILQNGKEVTSTKAWYKKRRPEILNLFANQQFGIAPDRAHVHFKVFDTGTPVFNGKAIRKQITIYFTADTNKVKTDLAIYLPVKEGVKTPVLLKIGFTPNCLTINDPGLHQGMIWNRQGERVPAKSARSFGYFDVEKFLDNGIAVAVIYYGDIEPDFPDGLKYGIIGQHLKPGTEHPATNEWGAISAWAWGLSGVMDYFETDPEVDETKVALLGASRLGKTVLWAGANDPRFGMVIASCSGEGGAAISRRQYGETIAHMTDSTRYYYQFCANRATYANEPNACPVDAHMLLSLIAPRPLLLQTGITDNWSDPKGEFVAAVAASPVYELLGKKGIGTEIWPDAGTPILNDLGYYMHEGGHGYMPSDFDIYIQFIKKHFKK